MSSRTSPPNPPIARRSSSASSSTLIASMMALTALGVDSMLPALPAIGDGHRASPSPTIASS